MGVVSIKPVVTGIPNFTEARALLDKAEGNYFTTGEPTTIVAKPEDIVRFLRYLREQRHTYKDVTADGKPGVHSGYLFIYSCLTNCKND
jgi:hypothetical protein